MSKTRFRKPRIDDLPVWRADFSPGAVALWIFYYEELPFKTRWAIRNEMRAFYGSPNVERCITELIETGWMIEEGQNLRSVVPQRRFER